MLKEPTSLEYESKRLEEAKANLKLMEAKITGALSILNILWNTYKESPSDKTLEGFEEAFGGLVDFFERLPYSTKWKSKIRSVRQEIIYAEEAIHRAGETRERRM